MTAKVVHKGITTNFLVHNPNDVISTYHLAGKFYEIEQLEAHSKLIFRNCVVLDIGSNIGNHVLYYAKFTDAAEIYTFEVNPKAIDILIKNLSANSTGRTINHKYLGKAISQSSTKFVPATDFTNNLGGFSLRGASQNDSESTKYESVSLDELAFPKRVGFVKIDVEGMEIEVLRGGKKFFKEHRPSIAIEVSHVNYGRMWSWMEEQRYVLVDMFQDHENNRNYLIVPV